MSAMLADFVANLASEVGLAAGSRPDPGDIGPILSRLTKAGLLNRAGLLSLMLRRSDEHRIASAFASHAGPRKLPLLSRLVGDASPAVASAAMALVVARGRRRDGFGQPRIELSDLPPDDVVALTHAVGAALCPSICDEPAYAAAAEQIAQSVRYEEALDRAVEQLAEVLDRGSGSDDGLIEEASGEGEAALVAHIIAHRAAVTPQAAWDHLLDAGDGGLALLARMAGLGRHSAARLIADFGSMAGTASIEDEMARFDALDAAEVAAALSHLRLPRPFRIARTMVNGNG